jgi:hypothetical protein
VLDELSAECSRSDGEWKARGIRWDGFQGFSGLAITAAAASLGAPFWFDVLNRVGSLRNVGNKPKADA